MAQNRSKRLSISMLASVVVIASVAAVAVVAIRAASGGIVSLDSGQFSVNDKAQNIADDSASQNSFVQFSDELTLAQQIAQRKAEGLVIVGDSLFAEVDGGPGAGPIVEGALRAANWDPLTFNTQGCRATGAFNACFAFTIPGLDQIMDEVIAETYDGTTNSYNVGDLNEGIRTAGTMIIGLGTNEHPPTDQAGMEQRVRSIVGKIRQLNSDIDLHWTLNCARQDKVVTDSNFNEMLRRVAPTIDLELVDWNSNCRDEYLVDRVHYNNAGVNAYINTIIADIEPVPADF